MAGTLMELHPASYTKVEGKAEMLRANSYIKAAHVGCLVHAIMKWNHHELGEVDYNK